MCVVSMVSDHYNDNWRDKDWYKKINQENPDIHKILNPSTIGRKEFDDLKKEVEELKKLLIRAKEYDERTNQPKCEMEEKVAILKAISKAFNIDLTEIFKE